MRTLWYCLEKERNNNQKYQCLDKKEKYALYVIYEDHLNIHCVHCNMQCTHLNECHIVS